MTKRKTQAEFESELAAVNDRIKVVGSYVSNHVPIDCICRDCGHSWSSRPSNLLPPNKRGCPNCRGGISISDKDFRAQLKEVHQERIKVHGRYKNQNTKLQCECRNCKHSWKSSPKHLIHSRAGCPKCGGSMPLTHDEVVTRISTVSPAIEVIGHYVNNKTPLAVRCRNCDHNWEVPAQSLLSGSGCGPCSGNIKLSHKAFVDTMRSRHPTIDIEGKYENSKSRVFCACLVCGYHWETSTGHLLRGSGCRQCKGQKMRTHQDFLEDIAQHGRLLSLREGYFKNVDSIFKVECGVCDFIWSTKAEVLLRGSGCPRCIGRHKTTATFSDELKRVNTELRVVGKYEKAHSKIRVECERCLTAFSSTPNRLLGGAKCFVCYPGGFNRDAPAILYWLKIQKPGYPVVYKVGVSNRTVKERFGARDFAFITVLGLRRYEKGALAVRQESMLKESGETYKYAGPAVLEKGGDGELFTHPFADAFFKS